MAWTVSEWAILVTFSSNKLCPACGGTSLIALSVPNDRSSMLSDGQIISRPLKKMSCCSCGYGFHESPATAESIRALFDDNYSLGQRDPVAETARAQSYAKVTSEFLQRHNVPTPRSLIELGCGMGSLLAMLAENWSSERTVGVEPSGQLIDVAQEKAGLSIELLQCFAEDIAEYEVGKFDLCISVNVIEHTLTPEYFLQACCAVTKTDGHVLVICPNGEVPNLELLFYDHISSFTQNAMAAFATRAGLQILATEQLGGTLFGFQIVLMKRGQGQMLPHSGASDLAAARSAFLQCWQAGAQQLEASLDGCDYAIFGTGEFTDLLAAYCPQIVAGARAFVLDQPNADTYRGTPLITSDAFSESAEMALVAAVNPRSWPKIKARFAAYGKEVYHPHIQTAE